MKVCVPTDIADNVLQGMLLMDEIDLGPVHHGLKFDVSGNRYTLRLPKQNKFYNNNWIRSSWKHIKCNLQIYCTSSLFEVAGICCSRFAVRHSTLVQSLTALSLYTFGYVMADPCCWVY